MFNKVRKKGQVNDSESRSRSKETGSVSKRTLKFNKNKSQDKSPINAHTKGVRGGTNNVVIHQARNESVKRMFKNFNKTKSTLTSIRKQINISGSKPEIKQDKPEIDKSLSSTNNSYMGRKSYKPSTRINYEEKLEDNANTNLSQKPKNIEYKHSKLNSEGQITVNETKAKKEPKTKIEMVKSSNHRGDQLEVSDYYAREKSNPKIVDYFESARRISVEEQKPEVVPKIEISLNERQNKKKSHQGSKGKLNEVAQNKTQRFDESHSLIKDRYNDNNTGMGDSKSMSLNHASEEISALIRHNLVDEESIPNQLHISKKNIKDVKSKSKNDAKSKGRFKSSARLKAAESPGLVEKSSGKLTKDISHTYDNSDAHKASSTKNIGKKGTSLNEHHKSEIIRTISNKIKDSYLKNLGQGQDEHK